MRNFQDKYGRRDVWPITSREEWLARRSRSIGASEVAALFHAHPYMSAFKLWCFHSGRLAREEQENEALRRGRVFEQAVGQAMREEHPAWNIDGAGEHIEMIDLRLAATPDFYARDLAPGAGKRAPSQFLIQAKTVTEEVFESEWTPAPPAHYLLQVQAEMMVTGLERVVLAVMVMDGFAYPIREYEFAADSEIHEQIAIAVNRFWRCVERGEEPKLSHPQDAWAIARLNPAGDDESPLELHGVQEIVDACAMSKALGKRISALKKEKEAADSLIVCAMRNHSKAVAQGWEMSWPYYPPQTIAQHERKGFRKLSIRKRKPAAP